MMRRSVIVAVLATALMSLSPPALQAPYTVPPSGPNDPRLTTIFAAYDWTAPLNWPNDPTVFLRGDRTWSPASGGGAVTSVFGRNGIVTAQTGDYSVSQITGAAPLASPTFTGIPAAPTAAPGTNTTQLATTAFVLANGGSVTFPLQSPNSATTCCTGTPQYSFTASTTTGMYYISNTQGPGSNPGLGFLVGGTMQGGFFGGDFWATSLRGYSGTNSPTSIDIQGVWIFDQAGNTGNFWPTTDNQFEIGKVNLRPRKIYLSGQLKTGQTANSDTAGTLTLSGGAATYTFTTNNITTAPICVGTDTTALNPVKITITGSGPFVLNIAGTGTDVINYVCIGTT